MTTHPKYKLDGLYTHPGALLLGALADKKYGQNTLKPGLGLQLWDGENGYSFLGIMCDVYARAVASERRPDDIYDPDEDPHWGYTRSGEWKHPAFITTTDEGRKVFLTNTLPSNLIKWFRFRDHITESKLHQLALYVPHVGIYHILDAFWEDFFEF